MAQAKRTTKSNAKKTAAKKSAPSGWQPSESLKKFYRVGGFAVLLLSSAFWAVLGARVQQGNADQLVNSYLFENAHTFQLALLPGQHSFLLKWPVFLLIHLMGASSAAFMGTTVVISLLTVTGLAAVIYRIDKRPMVFGTLCLALASVLMMVPAQPYNGALLPVNMAMIATRNLEYLVYIVSLALLVRWHEIKNWGFWAAVACLSLLVASDKLFMSLSLAGAGLALVAYVFWRRWQMAELAVRWLALSVLASLAALLMLWGLNGLGVAHVVNQNTLGSYGLAGSLSQLARGVIYAVFGILTNFGANPAFDVVVLRQVPRGALTHLISPGGPSFVVNLLVAAAGLWTAAQLLVNSLRHHHKQSFELTKTAKLALLLVWTGVAAVGLFVASTHYYVVDARYLTILLFAIFVAAATFSRRCAWKARDLMVGGAVLFISVLLGSVFAIQTYHGEAAALKPSNDRNSLVAQAMAHRKTDILVGDYWRVVPIKAAANNKLSIMPLSTCLDARQILTSQAWQPDLHHTSFAYLLSFQRGLTDYPNCSLDQIISAYGHPNASAVVAGPIDHPEEVLLFYDGGIHQSTPVSPAKTPSTVVPITLSELPYTTCTGPTVMNVVAHQDDDLLFMNPDTNRAIQAGYCVRTVYVTAGDAGSSEFYWLSREQGAEAAYAQMTGDNSIWVQRNVKVSDKAYVMVANPKGNSKISLIFMRLPDGNLKGQGFGRSHFESLAKLYAGSIGQMHSVSNQSVFTADVLTKTLTSIMHTFQPSEIRLQANDAGNKQYPDHSDHVTTGLFAKRAYEHYEQEQFDNKVTIPLVHYMGYPVHSRPVNVTGGDLAQKQTAFFAYSKFDGAVCQNMQQCSRSSTLYDYLQRQYTADE